METPDKKFDYTPVAVVVNPILDGISRDKTVVLCRKSFAPLDVMDKFLKFLDHNDVEIQRDFKYRFTGLDNKKGVVYREAREQVITYFEFEIVENIMA